MRSMLLLTLLALPMVLVAEGFEVGQTLPELTLKDQHDVAQTITPATRLLIFSAERNASSLVESVLDGQTAATLDAAGVRYVADISAMPGMVTKLIALPKMRKRPYPMLLGREPAETAMLPREPGKVTLIEAADGTITGVRYLADAPALKAALGLGEPGGS